MISWRTGSAVSLLVLVTVLSGIIHGRLTNRWGVPVDLAAAGDALGAFPTSFGDWKMGRDHPLLEPVREVLQCSGYVRRSYEHRPTGAVVNMVLLVGPAGPTAVHTPDVCYSSQDYSQEAPREAIQIQAADNGQTGSFWMLDLRPNDLESKRLRSYYAWSDGERWEASENPRLTFGGKAMLYKLQLAADPPSSAEPSEPDLGRLFLQSFLDKGVWPIQTQE